MPNIDPLELLAFNQQCTDLFTELISKHQRNYDCNECSHRSNTSILLSENVSNSNDYITNIITLIGDCFQRNGLYESEYKPIDVTKLTVLAFQFFTKGSCLKCASYLGCQINATFAKNESYASSCKLCFTEPNHYNNSVYYLTLILQSHCLRYPSICHFFISKTEMYRDMIVHYLNCFKGGCTVGTHNTDFTDTGRYNLVPKVKLIIAEQLIANRFSSKQWKMLIFRQKVLLDLIKILGDEVERYFVFKQSNSTPDEETMSSIFRTWKYLFVFAALMIHKTHKYMSDQQKVVFICEPNRSNRHKVYYNRFIRKYQKKIAALIGFMEFFYKDVDLLDQNDRFVRLFMYAVIELLQKGYWNKSKVFYRIFRRFQRRVWRIKHREMKCHWIMCKTKRKDGVTLKKCAKCHISRYCSRLCQKMDWNYGSHDKVCALYSIDTHELQQKRYEEYQFQQWVTMTKEMQATGLFE
eukprot:29175_1